MPTTPEEAALNVETPVPIDLGSGRKGVVRMSAEQMRYFGVLAPTTTGETQVTRRRKAHKRNVYSGLGDKAPVIANVSASTWQTPLRGPRGVTGKAVVIPTELKTPTGHIRVTTIHFPRNATVGAISNWLFQTLVSHKPKSFLHNGNQYAVLRATGDVNPGNTPNTQPAA